MSVSATYHDGRSAKALQGTLCICASGLQLRLESGEKYFGRDNAHLIPPVGRGVWVLETESGESVHFEDDGFGNIVMPMFGRVSAASRFEQSWPWAIAALVVAVAGTWMMLAFGIPAAVRHVAFAVPADIEWSLSRESLDILDQVMFEPSALPPERVEHVRILFENIKRENSDFANFRIEFRAAAAVGANAFAIPGGTVIVTDEMIQLVRSDAEIIAVLAHEVGHLAQRHGLRILLQDAASAILIAGLTGDLGSVTALSATVPTVLMQAKYSRGFEREADNFSFVYLESHGLDPDVLSILLRRIEAQSPEFDSGDEMPWFSSHPLSETRRPEQD